MVVLGEIKPGRPMRVEDNLQELGENTLGKLKEAIEQENRELALALADYLFLEGKSVREAYTDLFYVSLDWIARTCGEEQVATVLRHAMDVLRGQHPAFRGLSSLAYIKSHAEAMRGHGSGPDEMGDFKIWEEEDRWVMAFDPCGCGGRMVRGPKDGSGSRVEPPFNLGKTTKPYPWSWGKAGVPYYCAHCCVWSEIMLIEQIGYPLRITEYPADDPSKPCVSYVYKDPSLIPAEYFERVGFKKDLSRFRK